jgi:hypothetical protein
MKRKERIAVIAVVAAVAVEVWRHWKAELGC